MLFHRAGRQQTRGWGRTKCPKTDSCDGTHCTTASIWNQAANGIRRHIAFAIQKMNESLQKTCDQIALATWSTWSPKSPKWSLANCLGPTPSIQITPLPQGRHGQVSCSFPPHTHSSSLGHAPALLLQATVTLAT